LKEWRDIKVVIPNKFLVNYIHFQTNDGDPSGSFVHTVEKIAHNYKLRSNQTAVGFVFIVEDAAVPTSEKRFTKFIKKHLPDTEHLF